MHTNECLYVYVHTYVCLHILAISLLMTCKTRRVVFWGPPLSPSSVWVPLFSSLPLSGSPSLADPPMDPHLVPSLSLVACTLSLVHAVLLACTSPSLVSVRRPLTLHAHALPFPGPLSNMSCPSSSRLSMRMRFSSQTLSVTHVVLPTKTSECVHGGSVPSAPSLTRSLRRHFNLKPQISCGAPQAAHSPISFLDQQCRSSTCTLLICLSINRTSHLCGYGCTAKKTL